MNAFFLLFPSLRGYRWIPSLLVLLLATGTARAQAPAWQTAIAIGQGISATAFDNSGNVFVTGSFSGVVSFGSITLISAGSSDVYIAKWNIATNSYVWAQRVGGVVMMLLRP